MRLVVGLGNPGKKYNNTRHNLGFWILDEFAKKNSYTKIIWENNKKIKIELFKLDDQIILAKPLDYMNNSGVVIKKVMNYYKITPQEIVIIHDDIDILIGKLKIKFGGSSGGHKGVESIIENLNTEQFLRIRVGVGNERTSSVKVSWDTNKFVLSPFTTKEQVIVKNTFKKVNESLKLIIQDKINQSQNKFNS